MGGARCDGRDREREGKVHCERFQRERRLHYDNWVGGEGLGFTFKGQKVRTLSSRYEPPHLDANLVDQKRMNMSACEPTRFHSKLLGFA